jgi:thymidine kinase
MPGKLSVIVGPMFAGKSTHAATNVKRWRSVGKNVLVLKHRRDNRYGGSDGIYTHDETALCAVDCLPVTELLPVLEWREFMEANTVVIEEAQFFDDLYKFCIAACDAHNKNVYVYGLDGNTKRESFGQMAALCPIADNFLKISALCQMCGDGTHAGFSVALKTLPEDGVLIGGGDIYSAVCRKHYLAHSGV